MSGLDDYWAYGKLEKGKGFSGLYTDFSVIQMEDNGLPFEIATQGSLIWDV